MTVPVDGSPPVDMGESDPRERTAIVLEEGLDRPWMTLALVFLILVVHLAIGAIIWSRGNTEWWGILMEDRGDRLDGLLRHRGCVHGFGALVAQNCALCDYTRSR